MDFEPTRSNKTLDPLTRRSRDINAAIVSTHGNATFSRHLYDGRIIRELLAHDFLRESGEGRVYHRGKLIVD